MIRAPLLGIDHGIKRIGIAVSDRLWLTAREVTVITRTTRSADFEAISRLITEHGAGALVIGMPHDELAAEGEHTQADTVALWIERLRDVCDLPVVTWDEQMTSEDAKRIARRMRRDPRAPIDDLAARVMLQSYLDAVRDGLAEEPASRTIDRSTD
ncbi:MAG: Holliday junction resolvase RuvX [Chloroflexi bacterium]|nr:Holliday junction resolvase RuvX [Chloroflexota bacterium]